jgi:hypothetical protein
MSETEGFEEKKYFERLNIPVLTIPKIKTIIKNDILNTLNTWETGRNVMKQCFRVVGPAGVGKTAICRQIRDEISEETGKDFGFLMIKAPVLSRDDFIIPFPVVSEGREDFKMLYSNFVPKDPEYGIFVIDEFSRGDHALQQLLWQSMDEYSIHLHKFPKGWFVIAIDNPDDSEYQMDTMEDAAGLRRQLHLYTHVNAKAFLDHAIKADFHRLIIEFIQTRPDLIYDFQAQKLGMVFANPASYEKLSDHLWKIDANGGVQNHLDTVEELAAGLLNVNMAQEFLMFCKGDKVINPKDIFYDFKKVSPEIDKMVDEGNNAKLGAVMKSFCTYMTTSMPKYEKQHLDNVFNFLMKMPIDTAALFVSQIDTFERTTAEFKYMTSIHMALWKAYPKYKTGFYDPIVKAGKDRS